MRTLLVMRHAKAEAYAETDHDRVLAPRGESDAVEAGAWLRAQNVVPDRVLVSSAARTRGTWAGVSRGGEFAVDPQFEGSLYSAGPETVLDLIGTEGGDATTVLVIGHNPTMAYLAQLLDDGEGDVAASTAMLTGFGTASMAVFDVDGDWADLGPGTARLRTFHAPD